MHYYKHNIGDYRRDTSHLTLLEHGIYRQMLDTYYLTEQPLPLDHAKLMRLHCVRTADEIQAAENVLSEFFTATDSGYIHTRCDAEISEFHGKSNKASESAKARWNNKHNKNNQISDNANAMRTHNERNADGMLTNNHKPITNNHKPIKNIDAPEGVSVEVWESFVQQRKKTRAVITPTVIKKISDEAAKAKWTLEEALAEISARGWRGFKAEWVQDKRVSKAQQQQDRMINTALEWLQESK